MHVPPLDKELGITVYTTSSTGIGGTIRMAPEDFFVEEVLVDGSVASVEKPGANPALGASASRQRYLLCVLVKRNWDTLVAITKIARQLGIDQTKIYIAGIKDAKAVTAQHVAIEGVVAEDVRKIHIRDIEIRPIGYFRDELSTFYLLGNRFTITINGLTHSKSTLKRQIGRTMERLIAQGGIPNFFGHQRFGTTRSITHLVGEALVKGDIQGAAMLFLAKPSPNEHPDSRTEREQLQSSQDFKSALKTFPKQLRFERLMLHHLVDNPTDFSGAFRQLPLKLQALFVQAYQSYLFNCFLSRRVKKGLSLNIAEIGDYVVNVERSGLPMTKTGRHVTSASLSDDNESIKAGKMRLALPIVGFGQRLSEGEMGRIEANVLGEQSLELKSFRVQELPRISGKGGLRTIISPVRDFRINELFGSDEVEGGNRVKISFMLLRGSYATILLREVIKPQDPIEAGF